MIMQSTIASWLALAATALVASGCCGDVVVDPRLLGDAGLPPGFDGSLPGGPDSGLGDTGTGFPQPPALGQQIDRAGRPLVSTILVAPFVDQAPREMRRNAYNAAVPANWNDFGQELRVSLGAYDGINGICADQFLVTPGQNGPERYNDLAMILADDRLWVNTMGTECRFYLGVELAATVVPGVASDCGGRTPGYDVADVFYSLLSRGATAGIPDGVAMDSVMHSSDNFPFLAAP